jgi:hypothetical protein
MRRSSKLERRRDGWGCDAAPATPHTHHGPDGLMTDHCNDLDFAQTPFARAGANGHLNHIISLCERCHGWLKTVEKKVPLRRQQAFSVSSAHPNIRQLTPTPCRLCKRRLSRRFFARCRSLFAVRGCVEAFLHSVVILAWVFHGPTTRTSGKDSCQQLRQHETSSAWLACGGRAFSLQLGSWRGPLYFEASAFARCSH